MSSQDSAAPTVGSSTTPDQTTAPRRRKPTGTHGPRKHHRPNPPMFWEARSGAREDITERPEPPACLRGVLATDTPAGGVR